MGRGEVGDCVEPAPGAKLVEQSVTVLGVAELDLRVPEVT